MFAGGHRCHRPEEVSAAGGFVACASAIPPTPADPPPENRILSPPWGLYKYTARQRGVCRPLLFFRVAGNPELNIPPSRPGFHGVIHLQWKPQRLSPSNLQCQTARPIVGRPIPSQRGIKHQAETWLGGPSRPRDEVGGRRRPQQGQGVQRVDVLRDGPSAGAALRAPTRGEGGPGRRCAAAPAAPQGGSGRGTQATA